MAATASGGTQDSGVVVAAWIRSGGTRAVEKEKTITHTEDKGGGEQRLLHTQNTSDVGAEYHPCRTQGRGELPDEEKTIT